jgi:hypothetical protein
VRVWMSVRMTAVSHGCWASRLVAQERTQVVGKGRLTRSGMEASAAALASSVACNPARRAAMGGCVSSNVRDHTARGTDRSTLHAVDTGTVLEEGGRRQSKAIVIVGRSSTTGRECHSK